MKAISNVEREVNKIRLRIYEKTKNMPPEERAERTNKIAETAAKEYGFKIVSNAKEVNKVS